MADKPTLTMEELDYARSNDEGFCRSCGKFTATGVEPDAEHYECPVCGEREVFGAEQAVLLGLIEVYR